MADANEIAEQIALLVNFDRPQQLDEMSRQLAQASAQARQVAQSQPTASQARTAESDAQALAGVDQFALSTIDRLYKNLNLTNDQGFVSRLSGELEATLDYQITEELNKANKRAGGELTPEIEGLTRARALVAQQADEFRTQNPEAVDFRTIDPKRAKDLASPDGFLGNVVKGAATGLAGIPGLAGIAASALGAEGVGQALGGVASTIRDAAPTDIGSSAASQLAGDIQRRASLPEGDPERISIGDATRQLTQLALTDGDFAADILGSTVGAVAGGGAVRAGVAGAGRLAGVGAGASTAGRFSQGVTSAAPAIGVGLGAGVDENLTSSQARILAGTGAASALTGGLTGLAGGQVAETAISNLGRNLTGRGAANTLADDLSIAGAGQIARNAGVRAIPSAAGEAVQEGIESGGESLGQFSQTNDLGVAETLANSQAQREATVAAAGGAALGAGLGAAVNVPSSISTDVTQNRSNVREGARRADNAAALDAQRQSEVAGAEIADEIALQRQQNQLNTQPVSDAEAALRVQEGEQRRAAAEQARLAREEAVVRRRQELRSPVPVDPTLDRDSLSIAELSALEQAETDGVPQTLESFITNTAGATSTLRAFLQDGELETDFRALYRNQAEANGGEIDPDQEQSFVEEVRKIDFQNLPPSQIGQAVETAAADAQLSENITRVRQERLEQERLAAAETQVSQEVGDLTAQEAAQNAEQEAVGAQLNAEQEAAAQAQATQQAQDTADAQAASQVLNQSFSGTVGALQPATGLDTTPAQRAGSTLPTIENTLFAAAEEGDTSVQAQEVQALQDALVGQANTGVPRQTFKQLALNSGLNNEQATAFGARLASALRENQSTIQLIRTAQNYKDTLEDGTARLRPITGADLREQFLNLTREYSGVTDTLRQDAERGFLVRDGARAEIQEQVNQIQRNPDVSLEPEVQEGVANAVNLATQALNSEGPLNIDQAQNLMYAQSLIDYELQNAQAEASIRRSAQATQGAQTRAQNAAAREERGTNTDFENDSDQELANAFRTAPARVNSSSGNLSSDTFFVPDSTDGFNLRPEAEEQLRQYTTNTSELFQELSPAERSSIAGKRKTKTARSALKKVLSGERVTEPEVQAALDGVEAIQAEIAAKKPNAPAEGQTNSAPSNSRTRSSRVSVTTAEAQRAPAPQGLLPSVDTVAAPRRFSTSEVSSVVADIMSSWKRKPNVTVVESVSDLPPELQGQTVAGITDGNKAYLVADQMVDSNHIGAVLSEELFHRGLTSSLGANYNPILDRIYRSQGKAAGLLRLAGRYGVSPNFENTYNDVIVAAQNGDRDAQRELTDEVLARIAQSDQLPTGIKGALKSIQARLKRYVQQFFPRAWQESVTAEDIHLLIREANNAGRVNNYSGPTRVRASRGDWNPGDYQTVDDQGNPVIKNFYNDSQRPAPDLVRDTKELTKSWWENTLEYARHEDRGQKIFRSSPWRSLMVTLANAKFDLQRTENEFNQATPENVQQMFDQIVNDDSPPLLRQVIDKYASNPALKQRLFSIHSAVTRYASSGQYLARSNDLLVGPNNQSLYEYVQELNSAQMAVQAYYKLTPEKAQAQLSRLATAVHAPERNETAWILNAELESPEAEAERQSLRAQVSRTGWTADLYNQMRQLAQDTALEPREEYSGAGMTDAQSAQLLTDLARDAQGYALLQESHAALRNLVEATNDIKRKTGSFSNSYQKAIDTFGWQNYIPLRGKGIDPDEDVGSDISLHNINNVHSETFRAFEGRTSLVEDSVETVQRLAISAIEQNAFQPVLESVAAHMGAVDSDVYQNVFQRDGRGGQRFKGSIQQMEINSAQFKAEMAQRDPNRFVLYNDGNQSNTLQTALVLKFDNEQDAQGFVGYKNELAEALDQRLREFTVGGYSVPQATQFMASLKTSRNPPFIPFDALRNMLTLGYVTATEEGLSGLNTYIRQFTQPGFANYARDITSYVRLYQKADRKGIADAVAKAGPNSTIAELDQFFRLGGPTSFLAALRDNDPNALVNLTELASTSGKTKAALKKLDNALITANVVADTLSRYAFYKALKDQGVDEGVAAARAKNTANFEQRGTFSGPLGGVLEFFRPTAVGATALINSTLTGKYGPQTAAGAFGAGIALYTMASLMAGVDDEGDDVLAKVNGKLYNNNFVFQYGEDASDRVQFGLGFGPIAAAISSGVQVARMMHGHQSGSDTLDNISGAISSQASVLPVSQISPLENPTGFVANSVTPSLLKPIFEVGRNLNSLGIPIRSDYPGADAGGLTGSFEGRFGSEAEMYEDVTETLRNAGLMDINPDNFKHVLRSYGSGMTYLMETLYENAKVATSDEEFIYNKKAGLYPFRQFFGSEYSQTPQDFYNHYNRVGALDARAKKFEEAGREDKAAEIRDLEIYQDNIAAFEQARKELRNVNKPFRPILKRDDTSTAEARQANRERMEARDVIYRRYLEAVGS